MLFLPSFPHCNTAYHQIINMLLTVTSQKERRDFNPNNAQVNLYTLLVVQFGSFQWKREESRSPSTKKMRISKKAFWKSPLSRTKWKGNVSCFWMSGLGCKQLFNDSWTRLICFLFDTNPLYLVTVPCTQDNQLLGYLCAYQLVQVRQENNRVARNGLLVMDWVNRTRHSLYSFLVDINVHPSRVLSATGFPWGPTSWGDELFTAAYLLEPTTTWIGIWITSTPFK